MLKLKGISYPDTYLLRQQNSRTHHTLVCGLCWGHFSSETEEIAREWQFIYLPLILIKKLVKDLKFGRKQFENEKE